MTLCCLYFAGGRGEIDFYSVGMWLFWNVGVARFPVVGIH